MQLLDIKIHAISISDGVKLKHEVVVVDMITIFSFTISIIHRINEKKHANTLNSVFLREITLKYPEIVD